MRKPGFLHDPIDLGLAGEVGNVELAAADRFHIGQRRPDEVFDAGFLGSAYRRCCLLELVGAWFPEIGDQKNAMGPCKCSFEGFRAVEIRFDDFVGEPAMLAWIAGQSAYLELAVGLAGHARLPPPCCPVAPITAISFLLLDDMSAPCL